MAKKSVEDQLKSLQRAVELALAVVGRPENMKKYGEKASELITLRTRLGYGVPRDGADREKLKGLKDITVQKRKAKAKSGKLSSLTTPKRSNLTDSGQLLDSIQVVKSEQGRVTVGPLGKRTGKNQPTNEDLGEYVSDAGRPFNYLSKVERKRITDEIRKELLKAIRKLK